jgi:hypothetical protein
MYKKQNCFPIWYSILGASAYSGYLPPHYQDLNKSYGCRQEVLAHRQLA